jgi:hypothetical protein
MKQSTEDRYLHNSAQIAIRGTTYQGVKPFNDIDSIQKPTLKQSTEDMHLHNSAQIAIRGTTYQGIKPFNNLDSIMTQVQLAKIR